METAIEKAAIGDHGRITTGSPEKCDKTVGAAMPMMMPISPPSAEITVVSIRNCSTMSRRCVRQGSPDADLSGSFRDGRQHDVHDPDAANHERDGGDCGEDEPEIPLARLGRPRHDGARAERFDPPLGVHAGSFGDGQHGDDR